MNADGNTPTLVRLNDLSQRLAQAEAERDAARAALRALETRNRFLGDNAPLGILVVDHRGQVVGANRKMAELAGLSATEVWLERNLFQESNPMLAALGREMARCQEEGHPLLTAFPEKWAGPARYIRAHLSPLPGTDERAGGAIGFVEDLTLLKKADEAARRGEESFRILFEAAPVALIERDASLLKVHLNQLQDTGIVDLQSYFNAHPEETSRCLGMIKTIRVNTALLELFEVESLEELNANIARWTTEGLFQTTAGRILQSVADGTTSREQEVEIVTGLGTRKSVLVRSLVISGHEDTFSRILLAFVDITQRKQAEEAIRAREEQYRYLATHNSLTGLYNTRHMYADLERLVAEQIPFSLIFMDMDNFKQVVDTHGHLLGSRALQEVAATIQRTLAEPAYGVAYGGDEFVMVLPGVDKDRALVVAREIRNAMSRTVYLADATSGLSLSASFGVASCPADALGVKELLSRADRAMFEVKSTGKGAVKG